VIPREQIIANQARRLGFTLAGVTPIEALPRGDFLQRWIAEGRAGEMRYLERRSAQRLDPRVVYPWARAIIVLAFPYAPPPPPRDDWRITLRGRIAAYALGPDYHDYVQVALDRLAAQLREIFPGSRHLTYVDTGPVLEREWATRAGLGWMGKHTLLLSRDEGSYFFLGELLTDLELDALPLPTDHCGTCRRCVDACPTGALDGDYTMDPRRCISYLTIEHRSAIPPALRPAMSNWIFGCDLCQVACPWNDAPPPPDGEPSHFPRLPMLLALDDTAFAAQFRGTALLRPGRRGLLRNACVALGNTGNPAAAGPLTGALHDAEPLVRGHAAWALGRLGDAAGRRPLEQAHATEPDPDVRSEISAALESGA